MTRRLGPPPRAVAWLERRLAGCPWRDSILGDLDEEHAAITRRRSRLAADLFYWTQATRLDVPGSTNREHRTGSRLGGSMSDFRLAFRNAFTHPAHTALVVIALALGLGLNAAVFSMGDALLLRPLQFPDVDRLVAIGHYRPGEMDNLNSNATPAGFLDWKRSGGPFDGMAAWSDWSANLTGGIEPERVMASRVSPELFEMLGVAVPTGRGFGETDATLGRHRVVILSDGLWRRRFGADPAILGGTVHIEGHAYTVVGIAPPTFSFPQGSEVWVPLVFDADETAVRNQRYLTVIARLKEGATLEEARAHIAVVAANLKQQYPLETGTLETAVQPIAQGLGDPGAGSLIVVWQISAALVLLIACANAASLLLARGAARSRELAVRLAIGASRWRVVRQLLAESAALAVLAVPLSLGFAWWMLRVMKNAMPARIADFIIGWNQIDVDGRVLLFTAAAAAATTLVFGLLPAMQSSSLRMVDTLKQGGRGSTAGRLRLRRVLVTAEIALALPLLVAAGMTSLGTWRFVNGPQGYDPHGVLAFKTTLPEASYPGLAERARFAEQVVERLKEVPGVLHAGATNVTPSSNSGWSARYEIEGDPPPATPDERPLADYRTVTPGYFDAMRLPLTRGRGFSTADTRESLPVAIVSESFIARHWPGQDAIGRRIVLPGRERVVVTIVGVAGDHIHDWFSSRERPTIFRPASQAATATLAFAMRTAGDPAAFAAGARSAVARVDPNQPIYQVMRQVDQVRERAIGPRYAAGMMALFGLIALILSVIGIYALVRHHVAQRRQEIGVRMALGAQARDVVRLTVRQAAVMAAFGIGIGGVAAYAVSQLLEANLMGMAENDPRLLAGFSVVLAIAALTAAYLPARRAAAIDPMVAMRGE
ncbi:MAG TPA: ABC transporter permease [Vicinamibacterales bacterium]